MAKAEHIAEAAETSNGCGCAARIGYEERLSLLNRNRKTTDDIRYTQYEKRAWRNWHTRKA